VHLTRLGDFKPLDAGRPRIELHSAGGQTTTLSGTPPLRPGAFRVEGTIPAAGRYSWTLVIEAPGLQDRHDLGTIIVYPDERSARAAASENGSAPAVTYLKAVTYAPVAEGGHGADRGGEEH